MAVSLKQKWLRILTQIAENEQDSRVKIQALELAHKIQTGQKKPNPAKINKQLAGILGNKIQQPADKKVS